MRYRYHILVLLFLALSNSASAQWSFITSSIPLATDIAVMDGVLVATCDCNGEGPAWVSHDGGSSWSVANMLGRSTRNVVAVPGGFVLQEDGNRDWLGSVDGSTWTETPGVDNNTTSFYYDASTDRLYATTQSGNLQRSTDRGLTWQMMPLISSDAELTFVHARGDRIITGYNNIFGKSWFSLDAGQTWTPITMPGLGHGGFVATNGDFYLAHTDNLTTGTTILRRSTDDGQTWTELTRAPSRGGVFGGQRTPYRLSSQVYVEGTTILYTANENVYLSTDDGQSWNDVSEGIQEEAPGSNSITTLRIEDGMMFLLLHDNSSKGASNGFGAYARPLSQLGLAGTATGIATADLPDSETALDVYPNPVGRAQQLFVGSTASGVVEVFDLLGRRVASKSMRGDREPITFDTASWHSGVYFVRRSGSKASGPVIVR